MAEYIAIQRKKDNALVAGSDKRYCPPRCIMANDYRPPLLLPPDPEIYLGEMARRHINPGKYKYVAVEVRVGKRGANGYGSSGR